MNNYLHKLLTEKYCSTIKKEFFTKQKYNILQMFTSSFESFLPVNWAA